jgi:Bacterial archaeo-eukaryotic release factor family 5
LAGPEVDITAGIDLVLPHEKRDAIQQRIDMQYARLFKGTAKRIQQWAQRERLDPVFIVGPHETMESVKTNITSETRDRVELVKGEYTQLPASDPQKDIALLIMACLNQGTRKLQHQARSQDYEH